MLTKNKREILFISLIRAKIIIINFFTVISLYFFHAFIILHSLIFIALHLSIIVNYFVISSLFKLSKTFNSLYFICLKLSRWSLYQKRLRKLKRLKQLKRRKKKEKLLKLQRRFKLKSQRIKWCNQFVKCLRSRMHLMTFILTSTMLISKYFTSYF